MRLGFGALLSCNLDLKATHLDLHGALKDFLTPMYYSGLVFLNFSDARLARVGSHC